MGDPSKGLQILLQLTLFGAVLSLWFTLVSFRTSIHIVLLLGSIGGLIFLQWREIRMKGYLNYLPPQMKKMLLERSIFDILCDIWYFQSIKRHIIAFISPFIFRKHPSELIEQLDDINPKLKELILRKGIINTLPIPIRQELTQNYKYRKHSQDIMNDSSTEEEILEIPIVQEEHQLQNFRQVNYSQSWDRYDEFKQFSKRRRNPQSILHLVQLLVQNKPIESKQDYIKHAIIVSKQTKQLLAISCAIMVLQLIFLKSSRKIYKNTLLVSGSLGLIGLSGVSLFLMLAAQKRQKELDKEER